jgi:23S rRNA pseudouridine1911/1915/1917 synthase
LDKETSGVLVIAKNPSSFVKLQEQFKERTVKKTYQALAHGRLTPRKGEIKVPVGRLPWNRSRFGIMPGGRESVTIYDVQEYYQYSKNKEILSFVELYPQSGRTHQIRVHLKYLGHPIFSDELYGGRKTVRDDRKLLSRLFLHAAKISFTHPTTSAILSFESPLPPDLLSFISSLTKVEAEEA